MCVSGVYACMSVSVYVCVGECVCVCLGGSVRRSQCVCDLSVGEKVLARRIRYGDYTIWMTHQETESRVTAFRSETYNVSSVPKSLCSKTVCVCLYMCVCVYN